ncbi:WAS/WASL-interacting protein family member 2-like isoform X2 [Corythoichthys intestinalis]|uniref:WAS/WASL-interacting protein family member 2-like isoform X2 n=1 Tax=Corythoichthys intestinalis TaxID=161448 RepID=UPI0025A4D1C7|nr:WAS/WASL-interacting protein family member 2-like isoform X2 [Corythoichthys intestinalis]
MPLPPSTLNQPNRQSPQEVEGGPALLSEASRGADHPYFRLYQYLHQGAPHKNDCTTGSSSPRPPPSHHRDNAQCPVPPSSVGSAPPPQSRRGHAPSPPSTYDRDKHLPTSPPIKAPPSYLAPPTHSGETEPPQRQASLSGKRTAPSPGGHTPTRGPAPPPPPASPAHRPTPPTDDFESKYLFHPLDDFPPPDEYRHFAKIYPSKAYSVVRGAPPLPPVGR